jgi:hypothetical protein
MIEDQARPLSSIFASIQVRLTLDLMVSLVAPSLRIGSSRLRDRAGKTGNGDIVVPVTQRRWLVKIAPWYRRSLRVTQRESLRSRKSDPGHSEVNDDEGAHLGDGGEAFSETTIGSCAAIFSFIIASKTLSFWRRRSCSIPRTGWAEHVARRENSRPPRACIR